MLAFGGLKWVTRGWRVKSGLSKQSKNFRWVDIELTCCRWLFRCHFCLFPLSTNCLLLWRPPNSRLRALVSVHQILDPEDSLPALLGVLDWASLAYWFLCCPPGGGRTGWGHWHGTTRPHQPHNPQPPQLFLHNLGVTTSALFGVFLYSWFRQGSV